MPRRARRAVGGLIYHVLNRGCGRMELFRREGDYRAFETLMVEAMARFPMRLLAYCLMPTHWHLVLWPYEDGDLSRFMFWLTMTHAQRWRHSRKLVGMGPLYQGRFKAFPAQEDHHLLVMNRYVERNALRAKLVKRAEQWPWSSLAARRDPESPCGPLLHTWPIEVPSDWVRLVNQPQTPAEVEQMHQHIRTGRPFGEARWQRRAANLLDINLDPRPRGRPHKTRK
jgi:putative transposase